jgi:hypothetical protein
VGSWWAYPRDIYGTSTGHRRLKYKLFSPSDDPSHFNGEQAKQKKIVFIYPLSKSKKAGILNLKTNSADWLYLCARFFLKIAIS